MANQNVTVTVDRSQIEAAIRALQQLIGYEQQASQNIQVRVNTSEIDRATQSVSNLRDGLEAVSHIFSTLGSVSTGLGNFASGIGNSFSGMSQIFGNSNVSTALTRFLTYNALRGLTGNLSNTVARYDIMTTFLPYMNVAGVNNADAQTALNRVNESILGLPIGLDESAQRLRRYQMFLGDVESATNLTIGLQHAILAGGASEQMQTQAYYQIDRLLSAGRLNQSRQWLSLIQGMGVSMRFINEQMGTTGMDVRELAAGLASGAIDAQRFLDALMALGEGSSDAARGLESTLDIYKGTIDAWINNIQFAATRGGENVMKAMNSMLIGTSGQGLTGFMKTYRDFLNSAFGTAETGGVSKWIVDNPEAFQNVLGKGADLLDAVSRFSASETGLMVLENTGRLFDGIATALNSIPDGKLEEFVAFATTLAGPLGAGFSASTGMGQMLGVFERFKSFDMNMLTSDISKAVGTMSNIVNGLLNLGPLGSDSFMSSLLAYGLVFGKPVGAALNGASSLITGGISTATDLAVLRALGIGTGISIPAMLLGGGAGLGAAALGGGLATWMNGRETSAATALLAQFGGAYGASRTQNAQQYLAAAQSALSSYTFGAMTPERAEAAQGVIRQNIDALKELYIEEAAHKESLQEQHDALMEVYEDENATAEERRNAGKALNDINRQMNESDMIMKDYAGALSENRTALGGLIREYGDFSVAVDESNESMVNAVEQVSEYVQHLRDLSQEFALIREASLESTLSQLSGLGGVEFPDTPKGGFTAENTKNLEEQNKAAQIAINSLDTITEYVNGLEGGDENVEALSEYIHEIIAIEDIGEQAKQLEALAGSLGTNGLAGALEEISERSDLKQGLTDSMTNLGNAIDGLLGRQEDWYNATTTVTEAATAIGAFKEQLMGFGGEEEGSVAASMQGVSEGIKTGFEDAKEAATTGGQEVVDAVGEVPGEIEGKGGEFENATASLGPPMESGFNTAVGNVQSGAANVLAAIENARAQIEAAAGSISINIPVNISTTTTTTGAYSADGSMSVAVAEAIGWATGGSVFNPRGSDIVPAMLTPGEYIIRKGAADFFGRGLLERINALDIGGAFDRLILNSPVTAGRFGGNVYNKDNHASVVQNYYNSSPDYGNRRAWRFAHSL